LGITNKKRHRSLVAHACIPWEAEFRRILDPSHTGENFHETPSYPIAVHSGGHLSFCLWHESKNRRSIVQDGLGKIYKTNRAQRAGCVAHALESLLSNHKTLSSNLSNMKN
jgi:hypothetical protein